MYIELKRVDFCSYPDVFEEQFKSVKDLVNTILTSEIDKMSSDEYYELLNLVSEGICLGPEDYKMLAREITGVRYLKSGFIASKMTKNNDQVFYAIVYNGDIDLNRVYSKKEIKEFVKNKNICLMSEFYDSKDIGCRFPFLVVDGIEDIPTNKFTKEEYEDLNPVSCFDYCKLLKINSSVDYGISFLYNEVYEATEKFSGLMYNIDKSDKYYQEELNYLKKKITQTRLLKILRTYILKMHSDNEFLKYYNMNSYLSVYNMIKEVANVKRLTPGVHYGPIYFGSK